MGILIAGLGNPGKQYEKTRHNAGFLAIDVIAEALQETWKHDKGSRSEVIETRYFDTKLILVKPQTYMNKSGEALASLVQKFKIDPQNVWILSDDVALPLGTLRIRKDGSAGGHNGLKSVIEHLGTENFVRFRIGVTEKPEHIALEDYVLQKFSKDETVHLQKVLVKTRETVLKCIADGVTDVSIRVD